MGVGGLHLLGAPMQYTYLMNSTKRLGVNMECIRTLFLQRRPGRLCIYSIKKH
jgi:hypothetical protein